MFLQAIGLLIRGKNINVEKLSTNLSGVTEFQ